MKFEDVENARNFYNIKRAKVKKKTISIVLPIELILIVLYLILNWGTIFSTADFFNSKHFIAIFPLLIAAIFVFTLPFIIVLIVTSTATRRELLQYKKAYKGYFVEQALNKTFADIQYNHDAGLNKAVLTSIGVIDTGNEYSSNDLTVGKYKNVGFIQADVCIQKEEQERDNDGNIDTYYVTIFCGRFMIFEFPKKFDSKLIVEAPYSSYLIPNEKMEHIETESVEFNKSFSVYAEDGLDAFYILTPDFMEKVQELSQLYGNNISFCFADNKMIVGINDDGDVFEPPSPEKPIDESAETTKIYKELKLIIGIVDELKLNRNK